MNVLQSTITPPKMAGTEQYPPSVKGYSFEIPLCILARSFSSSPLLKVEIVMANSSAAQVPASELHG